MQAVTEVVRIEYNSIQVNISNR